MSNIHEGPLATYNSLTDRNLSGYFGNTRMRRHLRKAGLINRRGEIVSENQYRINMARKEHKKHVKDLLAQAIVHKTLDLERYRQVEIKRKLEEIAKIELVRRVRASRGRKGDEDVLPYLSPRSMSRPQSERPSESSSVQRRPKSAPAPPRNRPSSSRGFVDPYEDVIYVDDDGRPVSPPPSARASSKDLRNEGIDSRHLYALDSEALQQYAMKLSKSERGRDGATSPYLISQYPVPPRSERVKSARSPRRSARMSARPEHQQKEKKAGVRGTLMLHRQEPAMMHQGEVQTLCEITMKYHGPNLTLPRDQHDPTQEVAIEQQHCGGNTLPVFKERLQPGKTFSFISRRHRGYPFSLTLYIDGRVDCRISTCCEYKHGVGVRLGGKMGHFSLTRITGATPCYKCKLCCQAPPRSLKLKKSSFKKKRSPEPHEEVTVDNTPRSPVVPTKMEEQEINGKSDDDNYEDDFEDEENKYDDDFEADSNEDRRQIIGLQVDEVRENGQTVKIDIKEKEEEEAKEGTLPENRRIEGYSSEDEDLQGGKEPFKVSADVHQTKQRERRSSSSSSSSGSSRSTTPVQKVIQPTPVVIPKSPKKEDQPLKSDRTDITERSTTSTTSGSLTTATESTLEPRPPSAPKPQRRSKTSSSSSSSSSSSEDTEDEKYKRKKRDKRLKAEAERMKKEMEEKELERKKRQQEEEEKKKKEEEERKKRFEEEDRKRREEMSNRNEERKQRELEISQRKEAEDRKREEEQERRKAEEERMQAAYEKQLQLIKMQRESDNNLLSPKKGEPQSSEKSVIEVEARTSYASQPTPSKEHEKEQQTLSSDTESTTTRTSDTTATTESEGDKEKEKPAVTPMTTITEEKGKPTERRSSTSSTGSSSSSSSEGELKVNDQKKEVEPVKDEIRLESVPETKQATVEVKEDVEKPVVTKAEQKVPSSDSSSSSGSSSESESDEDNKRVESPKPVVNETKVVQEQEMSKTTVTAVAPPPPLQQQQPVSSSSGDTTTTETDSESTPRPVAQQQPQQEVQKPPSPVIEEKKEEPLKGMTTDEPPQSVTMETKAETPKKEETEDSSSDSSSSDSSSDSESESETEDDKKQTSGQGKSVSESDGENMHGGNDPENVAGEGTRPESRLAQSSVKPPVSVDGSILPLIKDESSVELNGIKLDDEQVTQLCNYIAEKDAINTVTVRNAGLDDMAFQNVALSLQVTLSTPSLLNFSQNQLSGKAMTHLSPAIKKNMELDILILNGNPIGNVGCKVIIDAILKAKDPFLFLRRASGYLTPSEARAQEAEGKPIEQDEPENKCKIREIDLGDTKISDAGITELSRLLENNKTVVSLNLNGNTDISVKGWERFGQALKKNSTLKTLSLDFTNIGDDGLECLVKGLMVNTGIKALELESAGLTEKGGRLLCDLLKSNSSIMELTATTGNSISESTLDEIRKYLSLNNKS